jgi:hypothetical protein
LYYTKRTNFSFKKFILLLIFTVAFYSTLIIFFQVDMFTMGFNFIMLLLAIFVIVILHKRIKNDKNYFIGLVVVLSLSSLILTLYNLIVFLLFVIMLHKKNPEYNVQKFWEEHM